MNKQTCPFNEKACDDWCKLYVGGAHNKCTIQRIADRILDVRHELEILNGKVKPESTD